MTSWDDKAPLPGQVLVILARAISAQAIRTGLVPPPRETKGAVWITDPAMFGSMSLGRLIERLVPTSATVELVNPDFGYAPTSDEPGFDDFCQLMHDLAVDGATPRGHGRPPMRERVDHAAEGWNVLVGKARGTAWARC